MLISSLIKRPITVFIITVLVFGFGVFLSTRLKVELIPDVQFPRVFVVTSYANANASEVESAITEPLENTLKGLENLKEITSFSVEGASNIDIEFEYGTSLEKNVNNVRAKLDQVSGQLPTDVKPILFQFSSGDIPVVTLGIRANRSNNEIREVVEDVLVPVFEQVDGVAYTEISGGLVSNVFVNISLYKLKEFGLAITDVQRAIANNGKRVSVGSIETTNRNIGLLLNTKYEDVNVLKSIVVSQTIDADGEPSYIQLQDIAEVYKGFEDDTAYAFIDDEPMVIVTFFKQSGASIVEVSDNVVNSIEEFARIAPPDFSFQRIEDNSKTIRLNLQNIATAVLFGGTLAILILIIFLRNMASVLVVSLSIPISVIIALMVMYFLNLSLNIMTLAGLALGIGMLVDNSIVVLENIYIKRMNGVKLLSAAQFGATEMVRPIFASTLTTVMVFSPMLIFRKDLGVTGAFFGNLAATIVVSLIASFIVAAFLVPIMASHYIPINPVHHKGIFKKFDNLFEAIFGWITKTYKAILGYTIPRRKRFLVLILFVALLPLALVPTLGFEFFPKFKQDGISVKFEFPAGASADDMLVVMNKVKKDLSPIIPNLKFSILSVNSGNSAGQSFGDSVLASAGSGRIVYMFEKAKTFEEIDEIRDIVTPLLREYVGVDYSVRAYGNRSGGGRRGGGIGGASTVSIDVKSNDYVALSDTVQLFKDVLRQSPAFVDVSDSQAAENIEYTISVDTTKANLQGISANDIANSMSSALKGNTSVKFTDGAEERDILIRLSDSDRKNIDVINQIDVRNTQGVLIPISNFVSIAPSQGLDYIERKNGQRNITISAVLDQGYKLNDGVAIAQDLLSRIPKDENVLYFFSGDFEETRKNINLMLSIAIIAVALVFGIMASQFESLVSPFIIIFTIPLTFFGVFLLYFFLGVTLSSFSMIGIVILIGLAVNHGIVMVDYINLLRKRGKSLKEAVIEGASSRLLPIMMTTFTTVLGLSPTAFIAFEGSEFIRPIAITVVGGLSTSAFLSVFFVPLLYYVVIHSVLRREEKRKIRKQKKAQVVPLKTN